MRTHAALRAVFGAIKSNQEGSQAQKLEKLRKELKEKKCGSFKRKGNEIQYKFNEDLKKKLEEAAPLVGSPGDTSAEQLKKLLEESI